MAQSKFEQEMRKRVEALQAGLGIPTSRAFMVWYAMEAFRLDEEEALEASSYDGGNDRGVDLFHVDDETERVVIGQGKFLARSERFPKPEELALLLQTINELDDAQGLRDAGRDDLASAAADLAEARAKGYSVELQFVYPGAASVELERVARTFNQKYLREDLSVSIVRLENLELIHEDFVGVSGRVESGRIAINPEDFFIQDGPWGESLVTTVSGASLKALYEEHGDRLFDQNVRLFLGTRKGSVNAGIQETLRDVNERENFWAYNNGITLVASHFKLVEDDTAVEMTDFSVVNGCQTTVSIAGAADAAVAKVSVVGRIVAAERPDLVEKIIKFTNSQTPIKLWDLSARDKLQQRLKDELAEQDPAWFYALRRGEFDTEPDKDKFGKYGSRRLLQFPLSAQFLAAMRGMPVEAYKEKAALFREHKAKVFPGDTRGSDLLWAWAIGVEADKAIREYRAQVGLDERASTILRRGARFFVAAVAAHLLRERNGIDVFAKVDAARLGDGAMRDRLHNYALVAVSYYVEMMRDMVEASQDLSTLLRRPETAEVLERRIQERMFREKLAKKALDEMLPKLPGIAK